MAVVCLANHVASAEQQQVDDVVCMFVVRCSLVAHIFIIKIIIFVFGAEGQTAATERECVGGSATQQHRSPSTAERITKRKTEQNRKKNSTRTRCP